MRFTGFHRAIAIFHREHRQTFPIHFGNEILVEELDKLRNRYKQAGLQAPSYTAMVIKAIAIGIKETSKQYPEINSFLTGFAGWKTIHTFDRISAGVAVSRDEDGLDRTIHGVIQDPEQTPLSKITAQLKIFSTGVVKDIDYLRNCYYLFRAPRIVQEIICWCGKTFPKNRRLYRGTFAITTIGKFGVDWQLMLPQSATLQFGFGAIRERPVVKDGQVVSARTFYLTHSFDRRLMNGKPCTILMERIREILNHAEFDDNPEEKAQ